MQNDKIRHASPYDLSSKTIAKKLSKTARRNNPAMYTISVTLLLTTEVEFTEQDIKLQIEYAINAACTELERNKLSPTYKLGGLKEI